MVRKKREHFIGVPQDLGVGNATRGGAVEVRMDNNTDEERSVSEGSARGAAIERLIVEEERNSSNTAP